MDSDFIERIQNISLTSEEEEPITVRAICREEILEEYSLSLIGKFLTTHPFNLRATKNLQWSVWKMGNNLKIIDMGEEMGEGYDSQDNTVHELADVGSGMGLALRSNQRGCEARYRPGYWEGGDSVL
nr:hypothetical protein CFP56_75429 [Quercus suber]